MSTGITITLLVYLIVYYLIDGYMKNVMECESSLLWLLWPIILMIVLAALILWGFYALCKCISDELTHILGLDQ